jgi:hypothetical protein
MTSYGLLPTLAPVFELYSEPPTEVEEESQSFIEASFGKVLGTRGKHRTFYPTLPRERFGKIVAKIDEFSTWATKSSAWVQFRVYTFVLKGQAYRCEEQKKFPYQRTVALVGRSTKPVFLGIPTESSYAIRVSKCFEREVLEGTDEFKLVKEFMSAHHASISNKSSGGNSSSRLVMSSPDDDSSTVPKVGLQSVCYASHFKYTLKSARGQDFSYVFAVDHVADDEGSLANSQDQYTFVITSTKRPNTLGIDDVNDVTSLLEKIQSVFHPTSKDRLPEVGHTK